MDATAMIMNHLFVWGPHPKAEHLVRDALSFENRLSKRGRNPGTQNAKVATATSREKHARRHGRIPAGFRLDSGGTIL